MNPFISSNHLTIYTDPDLMDSSLTYLFDGDPLFIHVERGMLFRHAAALQLAIDYSKHNNIAYTPSLDNWRAEAKSFYEMGAMFSGRRSFIPEIPDAAVQNEQVIVRLRVRESYLRNAKPTVPSSPSISSLVPSSGSRPSSRTSRVNSKLSNRSSTYPSSNGSKSPKKPMGNPPLTGDLRKDCSSRRGRVSLDRSQKLQWVST